MKKIVLSLLVIMFITSFCEISNAEGQIRVLLNGQEIFFEDQEPVIVNDRTLVPVRKIFEELGLTVGWDEATQKVTGENEGKKIELYINSTAAKINGSGTEIDVPAQIINGRTMVPLRFISESLDKEVTWDGDTMTVDIDEQELDIIKDEATTSVNIKKGNIRVNVPIRLIEDGEYKLDISDAVVYEKEVLAFKLSDLVNTNGILWGQYKSVNTNIDDRYKFASIICNDLVRIEDANKNGINEIYIYLDAYEGAENIYMFEKHEGKYILMLQGENVGRNFKYIDVDNDGNYDAIVTENYEGEKYGGNKSLEVVYKLNQYNKYEFSYDLSCEYHLNILNEKRIEFKRNRNESTFAELILSMVTYGDVTEINDLITENEDLVNSENYNYEMEYDIDYLAWYGNIRWFFQYNLDAANSYKLIWEDYALNKKDEIIGDLNTEGLREYIKGLPIPDSVDKSELIQVLKDDLDNDGQDEYVVSFGSSGEWMDMFYKITYVIKKTENGFERIQDTIASWGYNIYNIETVRLNNSNDKYIYVELTNGAHPLGCEIYALRDNSLETLLSVSSPTGDGSCDLVDTDEDGVYDGVVTMRSDYGTYYHYIDRYYKWDGNSFSERENNYDIEEYPTKPEDVIYQYIDILWLEKHYGQNIQTQDRINEIRFNSEIEKVDLTKYIENYHSEWSNESNLKFQRIKYNDSYMEIVVDLQEGNLENPLTFTLNKDNDRWRISDIK